MESTILNDDETLDTLFDGKLKIIQKRRGYRFSLDAILLSGFFIPRDDQIGVDLGTGSGVIPLILAFKYGVKKIFGVEVQGDLADMARHSVWFNHLEDKISIIHGDMKKLDGIFGPESIDWVISNPPYYPVGSGRINPHAEKAIARHEIDGSLGTVVDISRYLLKPMGRIILVYPAARLVFLLNKLHTSNIDPKRLRFVYSDLSSCAEHVLVEAIKGGAREIKIEKPLYIYAPSGDYTSEMKAFYRY